MPTHHLKPKAGRPEKKEEDNICFFAQTNYRNQMRTFGMKLDDRRRHTYVIGKTGMGKTTLMENMVLHDIYNGNGVGIVDPHGDFSEKIIDYIPAHRINDVVYFNPSDVDFPVGFNILEVNDPAQKHLIAQGLMATFKKIWPDAWSSRMEYILNNTLLALLDYPGSTLLGINRLLGDKKYRKKVVAKLTDPVVKSFWQQEFAGYSDKYATEAVAPIQNKIGQFLSASVIRNMVAQVKSTIDIREAMDSKKILIMNLSKGRIGEDNSRLLGGMLITKIQLSAMERVDTPEEDRKDFFLYVDEFQNFATPSFANILSEARKYRLGLIMAHQYVAQLDEVVADAVFGNVGTIVTFRVGAADAEFLAKEFSPTFTEEDIINLPKFQIFLKLMIDGVSSSPFSAGSLPPIGQVTGSREKVVKVSRERYARTRAEIEDKITRWSEGDGLAVMVEKKEVIKQENLKQDLNIKEGNLVEDNKKLNSNSNSKSDTLNKNSNKSSDNRSNKDSQNQAQDTKNYSREKSSEDKRSDKTSGRASGYKKQDPRSEQNNKQSSGLSLSDLSSRDDVVKKDRNSSSNISKANVSETKSEAKSDKRRTEDKTRDNKSSEKNNQNQAQNQTSNNQSNSQYKSQDNNTRTSSSNKNLGSERNSQDKKQEKKSERVVNNLVSFANVKEVDSKKQQELHDKDIKKLQDLLAQNQKQADKQTIENTRLKHDIINAKDDLDRLSKEKDALLRNINVLGKTERKDYNKEATRDNSENTSKQVQDQKPDLKNENNGFKSDTVTNSNVSGANLSQDNSDIERITLDRNEVFKNNKSSQSGYDEKSETKEEPKLKLSDLLEIDRDINENKYNQRNKNNKFEDSNVSHANVSEKSEGITEEIITNNNISQVIHQKNREDNREEHNSSKNSSNSNLTSNTSTNQNLVVNERKEVENNIQEPIILSKEDKLPDACPERIWESEGITADKHVHLAEEDIKKELNTTVVQDQPEKKKRRRRRGRRGGRGRNKNKNTGEKIGEQVANQSDTQINASLNTQVTNNQNNLEKKVINQDQVIRFDN